MTPKLIFWTVVVTIALNLGDAVCSGESIEAKRSGGAIVRTSVKLLTPKDGRDKRVARPLDEVSCSMFIPEGIEVLRGALYNPFYEDTVKQEHWRTTVAQWDFGLIGTNLFRVKNDEIGTTVLRSLKELASVSGHAEVEHLPLCVLGMSIGAGLTTRIVEAIPSRVIAAAPVCLEVGPREVNSYRVPMITVFGERDGKQMEILRRKLPEARAHGAQWAIAVQWRRRHEWHRANNLIMPLFGRVIEKRYPPGKLPLRECVELADYSENDGWLGDISAWNSDNPKIAPVRDKTIEASEACWLPDRYLASVWRAFVVANPKVRIVQPAGQADAKPFTAYSPAHVLEVGLEIDKGLPWERIELFDGDKLIGKFSGNPLKCKPKTMKPGIHSLIASATLETGQKILSNPNTIVVVDSK